MARTSKTGTCRLCRKEGKLSYEHFPPRSAFNDQPIKLIKDSERFFMNQDFENWQPQSGDQEVLQRGLGAFTLCQSCNNKLGRWYMNAYVELARCAEPYASGPPTCDRFPVEITESPLKIIKSIFAIMVSIAPEGYLDQNPWLRKTLEDKESKSFDRSQFRIEIAIMTDRARIRGSSGLSGGMHIDELLNGKPSLRMVTDLSFPPLAIVLNLGNHRSDHRLLDITDFADGDYDEKRALTLPMPRVARAHLPGVFVFEPHQAFCM